MGYIQAVSSLERSSGKATAGDMDSTLLFTQIFPGGHCTKLTEELESLLLRREQRSSSVGINLRDVFEQCEEVEMSIVVPDVSHRFVVYSTQCS